MTNHRLKTSLSYHPYTGDQSVQFYSNPVIKQNAPDPSVVRKYSRQLIKKIYYGSFMIGRIVCMYKKQLYVVVGITYFEFSNELYNKLKKANYKLKKKEILITMYLRYYRNSGLQAPHVVGFTFKAFHLEYWCC